MMTGSMTFNSKRMPEKWRRHFKIYRAKISIYLDTADFGTPLMVDASEMMGFLPVDIDQGSFVDKIGPVRPGSDALWIEAELPEGLPSRPNIRRIGAIVHHSDTRTSTMGRVWTGADHEYLIEAYLRDADGLSTRIEHELRFRLDNRGFLIVADLLSARPGTRATPFADMTEKIVSDYRAPDTFSVPVEVFNRVFFSMALMNCRNVSLRERAGSRTQGPGATGDAFHEVVITGGSTSSNGSGRNAESSRDSRQHLARGHFKTFTEDAPLLGKHVGTYWWGWQVRGQEGPGIIEKTYTLKPAGR